MEEYLVQNLPLVFKQDVNTNNEMIAHITEQILGYANNSDFFPSFFNILNNTEYSDSIRTVAAIIIPGISKNIWSIEMTQEVKKYIYQTLPNTVIAVQPKFRKVVTNIVSVIVDLSREGNEWPELLDLIYQLITGDVQHIQASLIFLKAYLKKGIKVINLQLPNHIQQFIQTISPIFTQVFLTVNNIDVRSDCLQIAHYLAFKSLKSFLGENLEYLQSWSIVPEFMTMYQDFTTEYAKFAKRAIRFYSTLLYSNSLENLEIPNSLDMFRVSIELHAAEWPFLIPKLEMAIFDLFNNAITNRPLWTAIIPNISELILRTFLPLLQVLPEDEQNADIDPVSFITEYHQDIESALDEPKSKAYYSLNRMACASEEVRQVIYDIAQMAYNEFLQDNNSTKLYSIFLMCSAGWRFIFLEHFDEANQFIEQITPLMQSDDTLVQCSYLILLSQMCRIVNDQNKVDDDDMTKYANPLHVVIAANFLLSDRPLVAFFGAFAVTRLFPTIHDQNIGIVREGFGDNIILIFDRVISLAREYGIPRFTQMLSMIIRDEILLGQLVDYTPNLVQSAFDLAKFYVEVKISSNNMYSVFHTLENLIVAIRNDAEHEASVCDLIFDSCVNSFDFFKTSASMLCSVTDLFAFVCNYSPNIYPQYWEVFQHLVEISVQCNDNMIILPASFYFHSLILRDPTTATSNAKFLIDFGLQIIQNNLFGFESSFLYLSAVLMAIPKEMFSVDYIRVLIQYLVFYLESDDNLCLEIAIIFPYFIALILYDAKFFYDTIASYSQERDYLKDLLDNADISDYSDQAFFIAISYDYWSPPEAEIYLEVFMKSYSLTLIQSGVREDIDREKFEKSEFESTLLPYPIITLEEKFDTFMKFLQRVHDENPNLAPLIDNFINKTDV